MADPTLVTCTADAWTKVATNVTTGVIHIITNVPGQYLQTYRDTGGAAPSGSPGEEAVLIPADEISIAAAAGIDVYIYVKTAPTSTAVNGRVRVDL